MMEGLRALADRLGTSDVLDLWAKANALEVGREPFQRDDEFLRRVLSLMELFRRYFDGSVTGLEQVPRTGPALLVGNHSGGVLTPDTSVFFTAWYRHFGLERPLVALALDAAFGVPWFGTLMRRIGEVPASRAHASRALDHGQAVLVYPGGDHEVFRPFCDRDRIDFAGRRGFVELAIRKRVPVVPVVSHGGHNSTIILARGESLARWLGFDRIRVKAFPIALQLPWGLSPAGLPGLPLPAKIDVRVLPPMPWSDVEPSQADDPAVVRRCHEEIVALMQQNLSELAAARPYPVMSRLWSLV